MVASRLGSYESRRESSSGSEGRRRVLRQLVAEVVILSPSLAVVACVQMVVCLLQEKLLEGLLLRQVWVVLPRSCGTHCWEIHSRQGEYL